MRSFGSLERLSADASNEERHRKWKGGVETEEEDQSGFSTLCV
jgi:hypothetical protein